jgi:hypothetical protein
VDAALRHLSGSASTARMCIENGRGLSPVRADRCDAIAKEGCWRPACRGAVRFTSVQEMGMGCQDKDSNDGSDRSRKAGPVVRSTDQGTGWLLGQAVRALNIPGKEGEAAYGRCVELLRHCGKDLSQWFGNLPPDERRRLPSALEPALRRGDAGDESAWTFSSAPRSPRCRRFARTWAAKPIATWRSSCRRWRFMRSAAWPDGIRMRPRACSRSCRRARRRPC